MGGTGSSFDAARTEARMRLGLGAATLVALATAWVVASATGVLDPARFPAPSDVWQAAVQLATKGYAGGTLWLQVWHSSWLVLTGFVVAAATGVPLGLLMGVSRRPEALVNPTFLLIRPTPPLAWIPLAILWFGLDDG